MYWTVKVSFCQKVIGCAMLNKFVYISALKKMCF